MFDRNKYTREYNKRTGCRLKPRLRLIKLLGDKCVKCGMTDIRCLQIDHINSGDSKESIKKGTYGMYLDYIYDENRSKKVQVLCANCNWIKKYELNENIGNI